VLDTREPIFVFGSNLAGRHGKGAALHAKAHYGAVNGVGRGRTGRAYALPTKDKNFRVLPLEEVEKNIVEFLRYADANPLDDFYLSPIGTGLAGYERRDIWAILVKHGLPGNVLLTASWVTPEAYHA
jgi:hypothetical protein